MMKWIATLTNFFLPGLGHLISGYKRLVGIGWMLGMIGLTYVELGIKAQMMAEGKPTGGAL